MKKTKSKVKKSFLKKFNRQSKPLRIFFILIGLAYLISLKFFTKSLLSLTGIETFIRVIVLVVFYLYLLFYIFGGIILLFTGRKKRFILTLVIAFIFVPIFSVGAFYIDKTYGIIDNVQKKYVTYESVMFSLTNTTEYNKIGMISSKEDPTGYIVPKEMIEKENIKGEIVEYDDYISMVSDLYDGVIDAVFASSDYVTMFSSYEKFANIEMETKVVYRHSKELENVDNVTYSTKDLTEPFTILLMGVDGTGDGISKGSSFNGDSLMVISFNPNTLSATVFSIPRDTYVPIACNGNRENKINSSAYGGTTCVVNTIQNLTGIDIDYYVKINFTGVVSLVNDLGGIYVDVPMKFCEQDSQRRFGDYEICLDTGYQKLDGEASLALARHRHSLPLGDFQRVQNQQLVVEAMLQQLKNVKSADDFYKIMDDVANNLDTNMSTPQMLSLYKVGKNILMNKLSDSSTISIQKTYLTGYDLTMYMPSSRSYAYTFQYYEQSLAEIVKAMKVNLGLEKPELVKTFNFSANEVYELKVAGKQYYNETREELLPNFVGQNKSYVQAWAAARNIIVNYNEIEKGNSSYNDSLADGYVLSQVEHTGTVVSTLSSLIVTVIKKDGTVENNNTKPSEDEPKEEEKLPNFVGKSLSDFDKWENGLKNSNIVIDKKVLDAQDIIDLEISEPVANQIYKQSIAPNTELSKVTTLIVYYYDSAE